jgi:hypothetical protein
MGKLKVQGLALRAIAEEMIGEVYRSAMSAQRWPLATIVVRTAHDRACRGQVHPLDQAGGEDTGA